MKRFTYLLLFTLLSFCFVQSFGRYDDDKHKSCRNNCNHQDNHPNCGHNSCKNDCKHEDKHPNCGHNSCKNDCKHQDNHPNCGNGDQGKLTLGNEVWNDRDGDGKREDGEPAIGGVTISLYTDNNADNLPDGDAIRTTMSDAHGIYHFTHLRSGRYIVSMPILPGYQQDPNTETQATSPFPDNNIDNDDNLVRLVGPNAPGGIVYSNAITLTPGQEPDDNGYTNNTMDLAECGNSGIGDFVWKDDLIPNGIQDAHEPGINGVLVTITFEDGRTATVLTHNYNAANNANAPEYDGYYDFINLGPGTYKLTFATPPGLYPSPALQGPDRAKDSNPINGTASTTIAANQSDFTIDAGFTSVRPTPSTCPNLSLGNMVFNDINCDGIKQSKEPGIGGVTVKLYTDNDGNNVADGAAISTIMTAQDGTYYFGNLSAGKYIVGVTAGNGYVQDTKGDATPNDNIDNDNNGIKTVNGEVFSNFITLSPGDEPVNDGSDNNSNMTLDFGLKMGSTTPPPCTNHCQCHNDCDHNDDHPNCGHNKCHNDCDHKDNHPNCGHNNCKNDCDHNDDHPNCGHNKCHNDCDHKDNHPNCGHNSCKNDCKHEDNHPNCSHNSCHNDCDHKDCGHKNCGKKENENENEHSRVAIESASSVVTAITAPELTKTSVSIFPNPANDFIVIKVMADKGGKGLARITDLSGKLVATKSVVIANGMNMVRFDQLQGLRAGTYYVQLDFNFHTYNQQLIVVK